MSSIQDHRQPRHDESQDFCPALREIFGPEAEDDRKEKSGVSSHADGACGRRSGNRRNKSRVCPARVEGESPSPPPPPPTETSTPTVVKVEGHQTPPRRAAKSHKAKGYTPGRKLWRKGGGWEKVPEPPDRRGTTQADLRGDHIADRVSFVGLTKSPHPRPLVDKAVELLIKGIKWLNFWGWLTQGGASFEVARQANLGLKPSTAYDVKKALEEAGGPYALFRAEAAKLISQGDIDRAWNVKADENSDLLYLLIAGGSDRIAQIEVEKLGGTTLVDVAKAVEGMDDIDKEVVLYLFTRKEQQQTRSPKKGKGARIARQDTEDHD